MSPDTWLAPQHSALLGAGSGWTGVSCPWCQPLRGERRTSMKPMATACLPCPAVPAGLWPNQRSGFAGLGWSWRHPAGLGQHLTRGGRHPRRSPAPGPASGCLRLCLGLGHGSKLVTGFTFSRLLAQPPPESLGALLGSLLQGALGQSSGPSLSAVLEGELCSLAGKVWKPLRLPLPWLVYSPALRSPRKEPDPSGGAAHQRQAGFDVQGPRGHRGRQAFPGLHPPTPPSVCDLWGHQVPELDLEKVCRARGSVSAERAPSGGLGVGMAGVCPPSSPRPAP